MDCEKSSQPNSAVERATNLAGHGFLKGAIDVLEVELARAPDDGKAWQLRGELLHQAGDFATALDNMERAQLLVPLTQRGQLVLADCYARCGHKEPAKFAYELLAGEAELDATVAIQVQQGLGSLGEWREAAKLCRRVLEQTPDDDQALFALARALLQLGQPSETAVPLLRRAVYLAPHVEQYRVALVTQLVDQGRCDEAYAELELLPVGELKHVCCKGCLRRLLELAVLHGDSGRAAAFAAQLAKFAEQGASAHGGE
ncbi:tetratricopeptide repeat protein [Aeoliella sp. SH292]|uniref:tetratricopeptide repeat protein n=1 Tax=Aeoliella sp. SH292 TaxID=3454464 RepID=UPI003F9B5A7B